LERPRYFVVAPPMAAWPLPGYRDKEGFAKTKPCRRAPFGRSVCGAASWRQRTGIEMRYLSLAGFLFAFWLALSGHFTPMLIVLGLASTGACVLMARRMRVADGEGHPLELLRGAVTYWPWLLREIAKSAWAVTKIILDPKLPISPTMTVVRASQRTTAGIATYANSITLTPGTITVAVSGNELTVHALVREGALDLEAGGMDRRVSQFEGSA
jgi:multicomponent Na+:H+ antiporter subunit E